jgi:hypothetical protein
MSLLETEKRKDNKSYKMQNWYVRNILLLFFIKGGLTLWLLLVTSLFEASIQYTVLGGGTHALHGSTSPPPSPVSQPAFKFKRFGVQFQPQSFCCSFFFSVADFFVRTKSFIDIEDSGDHSIFI